MNQRAYDAIQEAWTLTVKARALCPFADAAAAGAAGYVSPSWYRRRGAAYVVTPHRPLTPEDVLELNRVGGFINRSFVIAMASILEATGVVAFGTAPDRALPGGDCVQLVKWLRNRFAHGELEYDGGRSTHRETRELIECLLPAAAAAGPGFVYSIDTVLEPLKDGVLEYIHAAT